MAKLNFKKYIHDNTTFVPYATGTMVAPAADIPSQTVVSINSASKAIEVAATPTKSALIGGTQFLLAEDALKEDKFHNGIVIYRVQDADILINADTGAEVK